MRGRVYASAAAPRYGILPSPTKGAATSDPQVPTATFSPWVLVLFQELDCCPQKLGHNTPISLQRICRSCSGGQQVDQGIPPALSAHYHSCEWLRRKPAARTKRSLRSMAGTCPRACSGDACWMNACYRSLTCSIPALIVLELHLVQAEDAHEPSAHRTRLYHGAAQQDQHHWQRECDPAHSQDLLPC